MDTFLVFLALFVACITLFIQRQHNRKELLPILSTEYENNNTKGLYQLWLVNNGHGVAIIKNIHLTLPTGDVIELSNQYSFIDVITEHVPRCTQMSNSLPSSLGASSKKLLCSYTTPPNMPNGLLKMSVTVESESVYGDKVTVNKDGFIVTSNSRDAAFEALLQPIVEVILSILPKRN